MSNFAKKQIGRAGQSHEGGFGYEFDCTSAGYVAADAATRFSETADGGEFLVTVIDGGTDGGETIKVADDAHGGNVVIVTNDADNDAVSIQKNGEIVKMAAGRRISFELEIKIGDVSTTDWLFGLAITDTTPLAGISDGVFFRCPDSTGDIDIVTAKDSTETVTDSAKDLADDTWVNLGIAIIGTERAQFYVNGTKVGDVTTNLPDDQAMTPTIQVRNSSAAVTTTTMRYLGISSSDSR